MFRNRWFHRGNAGPGPGGRFTRNRAARFYRPCVEALEERTLLAVLSVPPPEGLTAAAQNKHLGSSLSSYLGVAFEPYVKQWDGKSLAFFNSYGQGNASVQNQVNLIGSDFGRIATYGAGYASYYSPSTPWNQVDSNWMVGGAAAQFNQQQGSLKLIVSQGIRQQTNPDMSLNMPLMTAEVNGSFQIAQHANATFANTVQRLIFTNEYVHTAARTMAVDQLIDANADRAHDMGLKVGVRSNNFGDLIDTKDSALQDALRKLVKDCDFIMLNLYPTNEATETPAQGAVDVESQYANIKAAALKINPHLDVIIGETGWASQGISFNDFTGSGDNKQYLSADNTLANAQAYYNAISAWAQSQHVETYYFEAIDEPFKSNQNPGPDTPVWEGPNGAEGHYGLWTYNSSGDNGQFVTKITISTATAVPSGSNPHSNLAPSSIATMDTPKPNPRESASAGSMDGWAGWGWPGHRRWFDAWSI